LIDENETVGENGSKTHGPDAVISMVDRALQEHCVRARTFSIHADNCPVVQSLGTVCVQKGPWINVISL
jgi:hypothetical protein